MTIHVGVLTAGGDSPGLNTAIRGLGKAIYAYDDMHLIGFRDGFRGLVENRTVRLDDEALSGILTRGGTILGTSRLKPHKMQVGNKVLDMTDVIEENYKKHRLDVLVCLGGGGTQKNAYRLHQRGMNVVTLPKTIDNDVWGTDVTFGFDTALGIATEAIDRLHTTAHSHHRIIVVEIMGNNAGWLALGAGIAGGADVIVIPEIPYDVEILAEAIVRRSGRGKSFSIVAVAEGARSKETAKAFANVAAARDQAKDKGGTKKAKAQLAKLVNSHKGNTERMVHKLEELTGLESRLTILGHVQRGGVPSAADRLLATRLGTACAKLIRDGVTGVMVADRGGQAVPVPLDEIVGKRKVVPDGHQWIEAARQVGTCLGDGVKV